MFRNQLTTLTIASMSVVTVVCALTAGAAEPQDRAPHPPLAIDKGKPNEKALPTLPGVTDEKAAAMIEKMISAYDLKPHPLPPIPDDPPPHEGAMIGIRHVVEPPDLVMVEVLDALPGRPLSGERLVRPDGTINLGFYGEVQVKGLTLDQVKVAMIKHLRAFLDDGALGLMFPVEEELGTNGPAMEMRSIPGPPKPDERPPDVKDKAKPRSSSYRSPSNPRPLRPRAASRRVAVSSAGVRLAAMQASRDQAQDKAAPAPAPAPNQITIPLGASGRVTITVHVDGQAPPDAGPGPERAHVNPFDQERAHVDPFRLEGAQVSPFQEIPGLGQEENVRWNVVPPEKSPTVFVDVSAYNTKHYYVTGDVAVGGRLVCSGNETVLDAIHLAGGLLPIAEPKDIRLVRPGRGGKPAKVYKVDLAAIQEKGDVMSNYQIFPGDRLIVGRNEVVKKTVELERLNFPIETTVKSIHQTAEMLQAFELIDPANSDELLKVLVDFWAKELSRTGDLQFDQETLREALLQKLKLKPAPKK